SGRFVDQAQNFEAGDFAGVFGGLALGVVEIGWYGDDGAFDGFAEMSFGPVFQLAKYERGDFWRGENFFAEQDADDVFARRVDAEREQFQLIPNVTGAAAHQALHRVNAAFRLRQQAAAGGFTDNDAAVGI